jgi:hypothetical protein
MKANKTMVLGVAAAVLLLAGLFLTLNRASQQADLGGGVVFADLQPALGNVQEIHLSKGDGSRTTLRKDASGWTVVERNYPADSQRVRELALGLAKLRVVERKTSDKANYAKLGVDDPSPTATGTLVEVVAGKQTWSLIVGKGADGRAVYARKPGEAASFLASPLLTADPDQKRWVDRLIVDLSSLKVHDVSATVGKGPAYLLTRARVDSPDLTLSPVPKGRTAVSNMSLSGQTEALSSFHFDDVRAATAPAASAAVDTVTYRTFDGQVLAFTGHRDGDKAYITVSAHRDPALATQFAPAAAPAGAKPVTPATPATPEPELAPPPPAGEAIAAAPVPAAEKPAVADQTTERLTARAQGLEFEIPVYKYEAIFRPYEDLLEKKAEAKADAQATTKAAPKK